MSSFTCTLHNMTPEELAESIAEQSKKEMIDRVAARNAGIAEGRTEERADIVAKLLKKGFTEAQITDMFE